MANDLLNVAIALIKQGKLTEAREILEPLVLEEPDNVKAWIWFAGTFADPANRLRILNRALRFNPDSEKIQSALGKVAGQQPYTSRPAVIEPRSGPETAPEKEIAIEKGQEAPNQQSVAKKRRINLWAILGILVTIAILIFGALFLLLRNVIFPSGAENLPVGGGPTSTVLPTQTPTPSLTPTAEPTAVPTQLPSVTPSPVPPPQPVFAADLFFLYDTGDGAQIWRMSPTGETVEQISDEPGGVTAFDVNPIAGFLAYTTDNKLILADHDGNNRELLVDGGTGDPEDLIWRVVFEITNPVWSPDGTRLAYGQNGLNIYRFGSPTTGRLSENRLPPEGDPAAVQIHKPLQWSRDSRWLAAKTEGLDSDTLTIYTMGDEGNFALPEAPCCDIHWSLDGQTLYTNGRAGVNGPGLWRVNPAERTVEVLLAGVSGLVNILTANPMESQDGRFYFFYRESLDPSEQRLGIISTARDGVSNLTQLTTQSFDPAGSLWAADASYILLIEESQTALSLLRMDGSEAIILLEPGRASNLRWGTVLPPEPLPPQPSPTPRPGAGVVITPGNGTRVAQLFLAESPVGGRSIAFSETPNGVLVLSPSGVYEVDYAQNTTTAPLLTSTGTENEFSAFGVLRGGTRFLVGPGANTQNMFEIRHLATNNLLRAFPGDSANLDRAVISQNGRVIAASITGEGLTIWDLLDSSKNALLPDAADENSQLAVSSDGRFVASGSTGGLILLWDIADRAIIGTITTQDEAAPPLAFSPDGQTLAVGVNNAVTLWDLATLNLINRFQVSHIEPVTQIMFSPDGQIIVSASLDTSIRLWDPATGNLIKTLWGHTSAPFITFSEDGTLIASIADDGTIRIWGVAD